MTTDKSEPSETEELIAAVTMAPTLRHDPVILDLITHARTLSQALVEAREQRAEAVRLLAEANATVERAVLGASNVVVDKLRVMDEQTRNARDLQRQHDGEIAHFRAALATAERERDEERAEHERLKQAGGFAAEEVRLHRALEAAAQENTSLLARATAAETKLAEVESAAATLAEVETILYDGDPPPLEERDPYERARALAALSKLADARVDENHRLAEAEARGEERGRQASAPVTDEREQAIRKRHREWMMDDAFDGPEQDRADLIGLLDAARAEDGCADYLAVCQALGIVYQADGFSDHAGPIADVLREVARLKSIADARLDADLRLRSEADRLRKVERAAVEYVAAAERARFAGASGDWQRADGLFADLAALTRGPEEVGPSEKGGG